MADFSRYIPEPVENLDRLASLLNFWNEEVCKNEKQGKSYIYSVVLSTEEEKERNVVWFKDSKTEPLAPTKLAEFPITLRREERRKRIRDLEDASKIELRSSALVLFANGEKKWVALFDPTPVTPEPTSDPTSVRPPGAIGNVKFLKTVARVSNRGKPSDVFLRDLVQWGKTAPAEIFEDKRTKEPDVYASVEDELGPYGDLLHRKACMLEIMRVLAGFESSWDWTEGRDTKNTPANSPQNEIEAGAWQVSSGSIGFGEDLKALIIQKAGSTNPKVFQQEMKQNHPLAMEYIARLLRHTIRHNGPVKRSEINEWLSKDAVEEFKQLLMA
jgi:hypothetical protein